MCFRGVIGFDGLFLENARRGARPPDTYNPAGTKLANNTVASVKSPYFGMKDFAFALA